MPLEAPPGRATRPTGDRVREAVFNALGSMGALDGARVADLYAGSGALGIEALSRGAASCVLVESDQRALAALRRNVERTRVRGASVVAVPVERWLAAGPGHFDVVLADPPYRFDGWAGLLGALDADLVVAESDRPVAAAAGWAVLRARRYGGTVVTFLGRQGAEASDDTTE